MSKSTCLLRQLVLWFSLAPMLMGFQSFFPDSRQAGLSDQPPTPTEVPVSSPAVANSPAAADATLTVSTPAGTIEVGQSFTVDILVNSTQKTRAAGLAISFNPQLLRCDGFKQGTFFSDWASANSASILIFPNGVIDNTQGAVSETDIFLLGGPMSNGLADGPAGSGLLASYNFTALASGSSTISLTAGKLTDTNAQLPKLLAVTIRNGQVLVAPPHTTAPSLIVTQPAANPDCQASDVNGDGVVDTLDVTMVSAVFGQSGAPAWMPQDINQDGVVDVLDVTRLGACFGQVVGGGATVTATPVSTSTPTSTDTATPSPTATPLPTATITDSSTQSATSLPTFTITASPTPSATSMPTFTITASPTPTDTLPPTSTHTLNPSPAATSTPTSTDTASPSPTFTITASLTATATPWPDFSATPAGSVTPVSALLSPFPGYDTVAEVVNTAAVDLPGLKIRTDQG